MYRKYYKTNKKRVKSLIANSYELVNGQYLIKDSIDRKEFLYIDDVILTIITLLQDAEFKLFDGEIGRSFMVLHPNDNGSKIFLMGKTGKFSMPLIGTNLKSKEYLSKNNIETKNNTLSEIPWTNVNRNKNGKIELIKNKLMSLLKK